MLSLVITAISLATAPFKPKYSNVCTLLSGSRNRNCGVTYLDSLRHQKPTTKSRHIIAVRVSDTYKCAENMFGLHPELNVRLLNNSMDTCLRPSTGAAFQTILSTFQFMVASTCQVSDEWLPSAIVEDEDTFDFIIVGAGSAGCVLANRLTENQKWNVLLVEAGDNPAIESYIPQLHLSFFGSESDWQYETVVTGKTNRANVDGNVKWPRGKALGGSSTLNGMVYFRGLDYDFQKWADLGNPEWHPNITRKYSKKAENLQDQKMLSNPLIRETYGQNGPQILNRFNDTERELTLNILKSLNESGFTIREDLQTANLLGSGIRVATAYNGRRASTATTYLSHIQNRTNLKIIKNAFVIQVLINNITEAYGVVVKYNNKTIKIFASLEIILSAGVINSPQLLMLSGVGPKKHLEYKEVDCKVDLPGVGQNLQDHILVSLPIFGTQPGYDNQAQKSLDFALYSFNRTGYFAQGRFSDIMVFYSRDKNNTIPDFQSHLQIFSKNSTEAKKYFSKFKTPVSQHFSDLVEEYGLFLFHFNLLHPFSRGNISLKSNKPEDHPLINANYFDDLRDVNAAADGLYELGNIIYSDYFKSIKAFPGRYNWSDCDAYKLNSVEYWRCISPDVVATIYHPVGTCAMGPDPETAVVDSRLRVHKVKRLRVIDASIMPNITSCNTNGPTIMIAERGADLIKEDYGFETETLL